LTLLGNHGRFASSEIRGPRGFRQFVSMVVDFKNRRLFELVEGRTVAELEAQLASIPGRENVRFAVMDVCDPSGEADEQAQPTR
jgi:hypothetical protein